MLEKVKNDLEIVDLEVSEGFKITKKKEKEIITIYDEEVIKNAIDINFNKKYRELLYLVMDVNESEDSTESDTELVLFKIDNMRKMILEKYLKYLPNITLDKYLKMLDLLASKVYVKERGRGR